MKKLSIATVAAIALASGSASAADLGRPIVKAPVMAPVPYFSWTGCYIGVHGGGGFGDKRATLPGFGGIVVADHEVSGGLAGGQVGCDYQTGAFVLGVEGSASWADLTGSNLIPGFAALRASTRVDFVGTVTGRVGWAWDRTLLYVKGGGAVANDRYRVGCDTAFLGCAAGTTFANADESRWGWLVGGGIEWAFTPNWSAKVEYNYMDFGRERVNFGSAIFPFAADIDQRVHVVKAGINYRFNFGGPIVASY